MGERAARMVEKARAARAGMDSLGVLGAHARLRHWLHRVNFALLSLSEEYNLYINFSLTHIATY